jgi:hypothetical protein
MFMDVSYIHNSLELRKVIMAKYKDLGWRYPLHFLRFSGMIDRANKYDLGCDFKKIYDDFKLFIEVMGPVPEDMDRPSIGRIDHSKGYIYDTENNRWNFAWQSMRDNISESSTRNDFMGKINAKPGHKKDLSEAAKRKFETTDAAERHSEAMKNIWSTEEGRKKYEALSSPEVAEKKSIKMKEHWNDEEKKEEWRKSLSLGQTLAWQNGSYAGKSGFVVKMTCPRCGRTGNKAPMERWGHGPDCTRGTAS